MSVKVVRRNGIHLLVAISLTGLFAIGAGMSAPAAMDLGGSTGLVLRTSMHKLWSDHVFWTRLYIISALSDSPDKQETANRLLKNQEHIGAALATYYGKSAGDKVTSLLKDHITIAVALIDAAKAKNDGGFKEQNQKWQKNAEEIASALAGLNPKWPKDQMSAAMKAHLDTTATELTARLEKRWADDARAFDSVYDHILKMANTFADGIIAQFPDKFNKASEVKADEMHGR